MKSCERNYSKGTPLAVIPLTILHKPTITHSNQTLISSHEPEMYSLSLPSPIYASTIDSELSATRESLDVLKNQHEALQRSSTKTIADLQRKLHLAEEEAARAKMALSIEKHKVSVIVGM